MRLTALALRIGGAALAAGVVSSFFGVVPTRADGAPKKPIEEIWKEKDCRYQDAATCKKCHLCPQGDDLPRDKDPKGRQALNIVLLTEYSIWKTHDKHAQAYAVLEGPRGKQMGEILGGPNGHPVDVTKREAGCLNCHAMSGLAGKQDDGGLDPKDGVSCGGCHGPSSQWIGFHSDVAWRKKTAQEKEELGLRDLRDPAKRASLCLSCHIGNAAEGKVVTHAMFAAGHPPLPPIEIATFSRNEPQHWRDAVNVPLFKNPTAKETDSYHLQDVQFQRTKLALVGAVVALKQTMSLAANRADFTTARPAAVWPELSPGTDDELRLRAQKRWPELALAHSDCYACHHDLKYPGYRQARGFGYQLPGKDSIHTIPGRPLVRLWPTSLLDPVAGYAGQGAKLDVLDQQFRALAKACNLKPFGTPTGVGQASTDLIATADGLIESVKAAPYNRDSVRDLMQNLCAVYTDENRNVTLDYESAKQVGSVLKVAYAEWKDKAENLAATEALQALDAQLNLEPYVNRDKRLDIIFEIVRKDSNDATLGGLAEFKRYLGNKDMADVELIKNLIKKRDFLTQVSAISNDDFNKGLTDFKVNELQALSDDEEKKTLAAVGDYNPEAFRAALRAFAKSLPK